MPRTAAKHERLEARVTSAQKELFQQAAGLRGFTLTEFMVWSAQAAAEATLRDRAIHLTAQESVAFVDALLNPPEPNDHLRDAAQQYARLVGK